MKRNLPNWLTMWLWRALLGEIYPNIRAVAAAYSEDKVLRLRYYLDRPPTPYDRESVSIVATIVYSNASGPDEIKDVIEECEHSVLPLECLDALHGLIYARREDNPNQSHPRLSATETR